MQALSTDPMAQPLKSRRSRYDPPDTVNETLFSEFLSAIGRDIPQPQKGLFPRAEQRDPPLFWSGDLNVLRQPAVCVIGAREVSDAGRRRARRIARVLAEAGVSVVSGLARGIDTAAHESALESGGRTAAVIGTPTGRCYPAENARLQETIWREQLLISQFPEGHRTYPSDFPKRNRLMAAVTDGSIIVEASDSSGSLHQAAECVRLGRWLFIMRSVVEDPSLTWPQKFLGNERVVVLSDPEDVLARVAA